MAENFIKMCKSCMAPLKLNEECSCGGHSAQNKSYQLQCDTILRGNYLIGKTLYLDGESTTYIGYDRENEEKILIEEYFPYPLSVRHENLETVLPSVGKEVSYKALMADFEELCKLQSELAEHYNIIAPYMTLGDNNTVYAVYKYNEYTEFENYLSNREKPLSWVNLKGAFLQLCSAVIAMHKKGFIHRGISTKTVLTDDKGFIYLAGFSSAANRTVGSEIRATLFSGYAAPEQYSPIKWQGTWTDVYALGALLYKCLTGVSPQLDSMGSVPKAQSINADIPEYISTAIDMALITDADKRVNDVERFVQLLLGDSATNTAVFEKKTDDTVKKPKFEVDIRHTIHGDTIVIDKLALQAELELAELETKKRRNLIKMAGGVSALIVLVWAFISFSTPQVPQVSEPVEEALVLMPITTQYMPDFTGGSIDEILRLEAEQDSFRFIIREEYHDDASVGEIIKQQPEANIAYVNKPYVILTVSMGVRSVPMPYITGLTLTEAMNTLAFYKIPYQVFEVVDPTLTPGIVGRTSVPPGEAVDIYEDTVYLYTGSSIVQTENEDENE